MEKVRMISPWVNYFREVEALFKDDPEIRIDFDEENYIIGLYVDNEEKADALSEILPAERSFGNISVKIVVTPSNRLYVAPIYFFRKAFEGNPAFSYSKTIDGIFSNSINYVVFKNKVVQYYNDDLGDANGVRSTLYQDIAKDVFGDRPGIYFCTDVESEAVE